MKKIIYLWNYYSLNCASSTHYCSEKFIGTRMLVPGQCTCTYVKIIFADVNSSDSHTPAMTRILTKAVLESQASLIWSAVCPGAHPMVPVRVALVWSI